MTKKNLILGGLLLGLLLVAYLFNGPIKNYKEKASKQKNFLASINTESIDGLEISAPDNNVSLELIEGRWRIKNTKDFYVEGVDFVGKLEEMSEGEVELASENEENKSDFQTNDMGTRVKILEGDNVIKEFVIGKQGTDFSSSYISESESSKTYLLKVAGLDSAFKRGEWYDKNIFAFNQDDINKIRFQYPTREFTLEKEEDDWKGTLPYAFRVSNEKVNEILNTISSLKASNIPAQTFEGTGLEKHSIIIQVTGEGIDNTLMVGDASETQEYFAKKGTSDNIYLIAKENKDILEKQIWELR